MIDDNHLIAVFKKKLEKAIINEFYIKELIDFQQFNIIMKKIDDDIKKLESKFVINDKMKKIVVKIVV